MIRPDSFLHKRTWTRLKQNEAVVRGLKPLTHPATHQPKVELKALELSIRAANCVFKINDP